MCVMGSDLYVLVSGSDIDMYIYFLALSDRSGASATPSDGDDVLMFSRPAQRSASGFPSVFPKLH